MYGLGTIINVGAIILGGLLGILFGRFIKERHKDTLCKACGLAVIFIGTAGALKGMLSVVDGKITYGGDFLIITCLALGALVGEIINIEGIFEKFGEYPILILDDVLSELDKSRQRKLIASLNNIQTILTGTNVEKSIMGKKEFKTGNILCHHCGDTDPQSHIRMV